MFILAHKNETIKYHQSHPYTAEIYSNNTYYTSKFKCQHSASMNATYWNWYGFFFLILCFSFSFVPLSNWFSITSKIESQNSSSTNNNNICLIFDNMIPYNKSPPTPLSLSLQQHGNVAFMTIYIRESIAVITQNKARKPYILVTPFGSTRCVLSFYRQSELNHLPTLYSILPYTEGI